MLSKNFWQNTVSISKNGTWSSFVDVVNQCATNGKTPLANPQSYRWQTGAGFLYPTAAELDVQSYMAIVAGMKGLFFILLKTMEILQ